MQLPSALTALLALAAAHEAAAGRGYKQLRRSPALSPDKGPAPLAPKANLTAQTLLHFLEGPATHKEGNSAGSGGAAEPPSHETFMGECVEHSVEVTRVVDKSYTDMQLINALRQQCWLDKEFVVIEAGFDGQEVCEEFAKLLAEARMQELDTGSKKGYAEFCEKYYEHRGGSVPEHKNETGTESTGHKDTPAESDAAPKPTEAPEEKAEQKTEEKTEDHNEEKPAKKPQDPKTKTSSSDWLLKGFIIAGLVLLVGAIAMIFISRR